MRGWGIALVALLALALSGAAMAADVVRLKDGRVLRGAVEETDEGYLIRMELGIIRVRADEVESIEKAAPAEGAARSPEPAAGAAGEAAPRSAAELRDAGRRLVEQSRQAEEAALALAATTDRLIAELRALEQGGGSPSFLRRAAQALRTDARRFANAVSAARQSARRLDRAAREDIDAAAVERAYDDLDAAVAHLAVAARAIAVVREVATEITLAADRALEPPVHPEVAALERTISRLALECTRVNRSLRTAAEALDGVVASVQGAAAHLGVPAPEATGGQSLGSGFFVNARHVLTNAHVVGRARTVTVEVEGAAHEGVVVERDDALDLALVRIAGATGQALRLAPQGGQPGSHVFAYGYGAVGDRNELLLVTRGVVSARDPAASQIIFDARVNPGSSGGPLVDADGRWVGVVVAKSRPSERDGVESLGIAIDGRAAAGWLRAQDVWVAEARGRATGQTPPDAELRAATVRIIAP